MMERRSRKSPEHPTKGRKREGLIRAKGWSRNKNEQEIVERKAGGMAVTAFYLGAWLA